MQYNGTNTWYKGRSFVTCFRSHVLCQRSLAASTHWTHNQGKGLVLRGHSHWKSCQRHGWSCPSPLSPHVPGFLSQTWSWTRCYQCESPWFWPFSRFLLFYPQVLCGVPVTGLTQTACQGIRNVKINLPCDKWFQQTQKTLKSEKERSCISMTQ